MSSNPSTSQRPPPVEPGHLPVELLSQYLDALLAGHVFTEAEKADVDFGLLHAIASPDGLLREKAARVLDRMGVMDRWRLARLLDRIAGPALPAVKAAFAPYVVGLLPDDFAQAPTRDYPAGARLFAAGEEGREAFLVESGRVLISKNGRQVAQYGRSEFFGNLPFLLPVRRTADAFALENTTVRVLDQAAYLARFRAFPPRRQQDELRLAHEMIRQLLAGLARYDSTVKVLVDYLFPALSRAEQNETLQRWIQYYTGHPAWGLERLYALFNLSEMLDQEILWLAHLDMARPAAFAQCRRQKGVLRAVGAEGVLRPIQGLELVADPPRFHRLLDGFQPADGLSRVKLDLVCSGDYLWPDSGNRGAILGETEARALQQMMAPEGCLYFAGSPEGANIKSLVAAGFYAGEVAPGLYALTLTGPPAGLAPPGRSTTARPAAGWWQRLGVWWRR